MELIIKDPVHNYVGIKLENEPLLVTILGSYEVQRLRRITQLGMASVAYPGAEHSRFGHSLGTMHIARKILDQFYLNGELSTEVYQEDRELLSIAALVHDIGHGPFSHAFEDVIISSHSDITVQMLFGDTELHDILIRWDPELPNRIGSVITGNHSRSYLTNLIASQLDADRLDYVLRDATMCGVKYGIFDLDRIIHTLHLRDGALLVSEKGQGAVEEYLLARYFMYWHVYFHKTILSQTKVFLNTIKRALDLYRTRKTVFLSSPFLDILISSEMKKVNIMAYAQLDESDVIVHLKQWMHSDDRILKDLAMRFITRRPFKTMVFQNKESVVAAEKIICRILENRDFPPEYYVGIESPKKSLYYYYTPEEKNERDQNIYLETVHGKAVEISSSSGSIIRNLINPAPKKFFIFYPGEITDELKANGMTLL